VCVDLQMCSVCFKSIQVDFYARNKQNSEFILNIKIISILLSSASTFSHFSILDLIQFFKKTKKKFLDYYHRQNHSLE
jgi:hypothetical protein